MSNPYRVIKQLAFLTGFCIVAGMSVRAQQSYYIYLQSENGQPFYAQIGDKVYSSSVIGHLILSGLKDNVCNFEIGFPQHAIRPQQFSVQVHGKDHGYQLKKTGAQEWALYSWQNQETIKSLRGSGNSALLYGERKKDDAFAALMAAVVNDSAVLYTSIVKNDAVEVPQNVTKTEVKPAVDVVKEDKKTDVAVTTGSLTQAPLDSNKEYKPEKPLFDTATTAKVYKNDKPLFDSAVAKVEKTDKPLYDTAAAKPKNEKPLYDTSTVTARIYKEDKPLYDTTVTTITPVVKNEKPLYDTAAAVAAKPAEKKPLYDTTSRMVVKETKAEKKPGVVKVQETTNKDGETKLVFIDSSESPANVITVYITDDKTPVQQKAPAQPASTDPLAAGAPKTVPEQKTDSDKKDNSTLKAETAKTEPAQKNDADKKTEPAPKTDADKKDNSALKTETPANPKKSPVKQDAVETARPDMLKQVTERPAAKKGDTLTIILESPQQKRDTSRSAKQEAPKPLYEPKQTTQPAVTKTTDNQPVQQEPIKADNTENQPAKQESTKPANDDQPVKQESTKKTNTDKQSKQEPTKQTNTDNQSAKQELTKPTYTDNQSKQEPTKAANTESQSTKQEQAKAADKPVTTDSPQEIVKKDTAVAKQDAPKAVYDPNPRPVETDKKKLVMINSDCARFASDNDVDKLRVKMLAENDVNKRVAIANKVFKTMCLYAKQMKALSELFPTDETKYKFLEMAWPFAADTGNFKELYQLFTAESYQTKFKTLVRY